MFARKCIQSGVRVLYHNKKTLVHRNLSVVLKNYTFFLYFINIDPCIQPSASILETPA